MKHSITVATCVSDKKVYKNCILRSLKNLRTHLKVETLPIFNSHGVYSAAIAGNIALEVSKTRHVMYVHQDIEFLEGSGEQIYNLMENGDCDGSIVGACGIDYFADSIDKFGFSEEPVEVGKVWGEDGIVWDGTSDISPVYSLDEILLIIDKENFIQFSPDNPGFHFYGLDICLQHRIAGYPVLASQINVMHHGRNSTSVQKEHNFFGRLCEMHEKWVTTFPEVFCPYAHWSGNRVVSYIPMKIRKDNKTVNISRMAIEKCSKNEST